MTPEQWEQVQKIELPPEFEWHEAENCFGVITQKPFWWHWFQYTAMHGTYKKNTVWYHEPSKRRQNKAITIPDPVDAAYFMAAKICLGMYE